MIVYLARDIPAFVMYCVNGESGSSLLIESTDSIIYGQFRQNLLPSMAGFDVFDVSSGFTRFL